MIRPMVLIILLFILPTVHGEPPPPSKEALGQALFVDPQLSLHRTQSCASCHTPEAGLVDSRRQPITGGAVSLGGDGHSLGVRNAPTLSYVGRVPPLQENQDGEYLGGLFLDGRAATLQEQALGPLLNPVEMAMPDGQTVLARLRDNPRYVESFQTLFGSAVLDDPEPALAALAESLATYERSPAFSTFDSKYDRYLRGEYRMSEAEELGRILFFSQQFTNCNRCHQLQAMPGQAQEIFSNFEYHNIGTPANPAIQHPDNPGELYADPGLANNPQVADPQAQRGKFRVPTLRNVAVTGPYMHNGVFEDLRTVVLFYDKYNNPTREFNPETGQPWAPPAVDGTLSLEDLSHGPALEERRVDALVAFMKTLTDRRYEPLLGDR